MTFPKSAVIFSGRNEATIETSTFWLRQEKDDQKIVLEDKDLEVIGLPIIKYGDSTVIMQHATTCLWVSYKVNKNMHFCKPNTRLKYTVLTANLFD